MKKIYFYISVIVLGLLIMGADSIVDFCGFLPFIILLFAVFYTWYKCGALDTESIDELKQYIKEKINKIKK